MVWLSAIVGFGDVLQQTPRAVIDALPSLDIFPPEAAVFDFKLLIANGGEYWQ